MKYRFVLALALSLAFPTLISAAQVDYFLKIEGIEGESQAKGYEGHIEIESFSWGMSQSGGATGGGGAGKVAFQDFTCTLRAEKASPKLMQFCANGLLLPAVQAIAVRTTEDGASQPYMKMTFNDVLVSSYQSSGSAGGDSIPMDSFSLNFSRVEFEYVPYSRDGTAEDPVRVLIGLSEPAN